MGIKPAEAPPIGERYFGSPVSSEFIRRCPRCKLSLAMRVRASMSVSSARANAGVWKFVVEMRVPFESSAGLSEVALSSTSRALMA